MSTYWRPSIPGSLLASFTNTRRASNHRGMSSADVNKSSSSEEGEDGSTGSHRRREDIILTPTSTTVSEDEGEGRESEELLPPTAADTTEANKHNYSGGKDLEDIFPNPPPPQGFYSEVPMSKESTELEDLMGKRGNGIEKDAHNLSQVKANHRSSLASLAESHRVEITSISASHQNEIKRLEEAHMEEMRNARRGYGFNNELVRGLHESYGKQIESLVLDLSEAKRQIRIKTGSVSSSSSSPMATRSSVSSFPEEENSMADIASRRLSVVLRFDNLDKAFSVAEVSVPHPGPSFGAVWKHLSHVVKNHLQALNAATEFFATGAKGVSEARKIRQWYQCAVEERICFQFLHTSNGNSLKDLWEGGLWKTDNFVLRVICTTDGLYNVPVYNEGFAEQQRKLSSMSGRPASMRSRSTTALGLTSEQLVEVEGETSGGFDAIAELERINRELGELEIHENLRREEDDENKENIDRSIPRRRVTVEEVADEDDPARVAGGRVQDQVVGLAISSTPPPPPPPPVKETKELFVPLLWSDEPKRGSGSGATADRGFISRLLESETEAEKKERKQAVESNAPGSLFFDELFSTLPSEKGKGKEKAGASSAESGQDQEETFPGSKGSESWKWMLPPDGKIKPTPTFPPQWSSTNGQAPKPATQGFERTSGPWMEKLSEEETEDDQIFSETDQPSVEQEDPVSERMRPFFSFGEEPAASPAPPPAPEPSTRKSPTIPEYLRAEESSYQSTRIDDDSDIDDNQPRDAEAENPFSEMKPGQCDTPVMGTCRSAVSSTPLLARESPIPRRGGPTLTPNTDPFKGIPGMSEPKAANSSGSHQKRPKYRGTSYGFPGSAREQEGVELGEPWESGSEVSTEGDREAWRSKRCGHGKGPGAFTWRRDVAETEGSRSRSVSPQIPPPSRSSMTTTDRSADFILPQTYQQNIGSSSSVGPVRYGGVRCMGPLGPAHIQNYTNVHPADVTFQHMKNAKELFAAGYRPNGPPAFTAPMAPVYAPNPPHSVSAFAGVPGRSSAFVVGNNEQRVVSEGGGNWPMRPPLHMHQLNTHFGPQFPPHLWNAPGEGPRRSYSTDSISPLLWKLDAEGGLQQASAGVIPGPMMPPQRPGSTTIDQAAYQNQMNAAWMGALGLAGSGYAQQPGTPGSHGSVVGHGSQVPQWFVNMQQAQGNPNMPQGFEAWGGSSMGGIPGQWTGPFSS